MQTLTTIVQWSAIAVVAYMGVMFTIGTQATAFVS
jgi:hypothetical protein